MKITQTLNAKSVIQYKKKKRRKKDMQLMRVGDFLCFNNKNLMSFS